MSTRTPLILLSGLLLNSAALAGAVEHAPGVLLRLYDVGQEMQWLPELVPGELPNVVKVVPAVDLRSQRGDFGALESNFISEVVGYLDIQQQGMYTLRLTSDDGAKLWIDDKLIIDHDGLHGLTAKDSRVFLGPGNHDLRIAHFNGAGDARLTLEWQLPRQTRFAAFMPVPAAALSHASDAAQATAPGKKQIIPPLRRGRPGDGRPLEAPHPGFASSEKGGYVLPDKQWGIAGGYLSERGPDGSASPQPAVWVPGDEDCGGAPIYSPFKAPYSDQKLVVPGGESKRIFLERVGDTLQGCAFRFGSGPDVPFVATAKRALEMLAVRPMTNGLAIEFTKPLDPRVGWDPESYYVEQWVFDAAKNTAPFRDGRATPVKSASVSTDRQHVFLEIPGLQVGHVIYLRLLPPCIAADGDLPWSTEAWYTLRALPADRAGQVLPAPAKEPQNFLTEDEKKAGWRLLFDGQTTNGWRGFDQDTFPDQGWKVSDGCLVRVAPGGDITTDEKFADFELQLEWRISPGGNSGIFFRSAEGFRYPWETGPEMQVLDNAEHPDGREPKTSAGSDYALHAPLRDVTRPVGFFNQVRIVADGPHVEYWLNGVKIVAYELGSPEWEKLVAESKFKSMPQYGRLARGHIVLQDHGDKVWYRNIKIKVKN
jgi:hypothetical protein